jgi:Uma2 family endonuclease
MIEAKVIEPPPRVPVKEKMTWEEFLEWCDEDTWAEWVDGEVQMVSPVNERHSDIGDFLTTVLRLYVRKKKLGRVDSAPFLMRLPNVPRGREPDILFVRQEHLHRLRETYLDGPADLVIEITSSESVGRDRGEKFVEYEAAGVLEYWLIDPARRRAEFYMLNEGMYQIADPDTQGIYRSQVVDGFWLRVAWLWQDPLPMEEDVLREIRASA